MNGFAKESPWPRAPRFSMPEGRRAFAEGRKPAPRCGINPKNDQFRPRFGGDDGARGRATALDRPAAAKASAANGSEAVKTDAPIARRRGPTIRPTPRWPAGTAETLVRLWRQGLSTPEIAARLGMTTRAIDSKVRKLRVAGIDLPRRRDERGARAAFARRRCLHCGQMFASSHIGNRICATCLEEGPFTSTIL